MVLIPVGEGGFPWLATALLEQIRSVDRRQLQERLGAVPPVRMAEVNQAYRRSLAV